MKDTVETLQTCGETFCGFYFEGELSGTISFKVEDATLDIHRLIVDPHHFRKGIARQLLKFVEEQVKGINTIIVSTGTKNNPAVKFYLKNGFIIKRSEEINDQLSISLFEKSLAR